jgi:hypothetical protein
MSKSKTANPKTQVGNPSGRRYEIALAGTLLENELNGHTPNLARLLADAPQSFDDMRCGMIAAAVKELRAEGRPVHDVSILERLNNLPDAITFLEVCHREALPLSVAEPEAQTVLGYFQNRRTAQLLNMGIGQLITATSPDQHATVRRSLISELQRLDADSTSLAQRLEARLHRPDVEIPRPDSTYSINGVSICTPGNITTISGQVKSGKSALVQGLVASTFAAPDADCLGCGSANPNKFALLHIDSEQSEYDHDQLVRGAARRAQRPEPPWLVSYGLKGFPADDIRAAIPEILEACKHKFGGIHSIILDGGADALHDPNDAGESNSLVAEHDALAMKYHCPFIVNIHENPGDGTYRKMRGHYGSQCERKAETNLQVEKDEEQICTAWALKNRHAPLLKKNGPRYRWDDELQMHRSIESQAEAKEDIVFTELSELFKVIFSARPAMSRTELEATVKTKLTVSEKTAERKVKQAVTLQIIRKTYAGLYELKT